MDFSFVVISIQTGRDWEYQSKAAGGTIVAGKMHAKVGFWKETVNASAFVNAVIKNGYTLPFVGQCPVFQQASGISNLLLEPSMRCLKPRVLYKPPLFHTNPLTVSEVQKLRLVLDLRHVNKYLRAFIFKYETLNTVRQLFEKGYNFFCFDLKSGYHHMHWQYLGFSCTYKSGVTLYFLFVVVPFGLCTAYYLFTKLMRPLVKKWRASGIRCAMYLDDGIFGSQRKNLTARQAVVVKSDLKNVEPDEKAVFLGFVIDTIAYTFSVPAEKLDKTSKFDKTCISHATISFANLQKLLEV